VTTGSAQNLDPRLANPDRPVRISGSPVRRVVPHGIAVASAGVSACGMVSRLQVPSFKDAGRGRGTQYQVPTQPPQDAPSPIRLGASFDHVGHLTEVDPAQERRDGIAASFRAADADGMSPSANRGPPRSRGWTPNGGLPPGVRPGVELVYEPEARQRPPTRWVLPHQLQGRRAGAPVESDWDPLATVTARRLPSAGSQSEGGL